MENAEAYTDDELICKIITGDHAAFREIFERYHSLLYIHAYNKLQNRDEAKDAVQEVFSKIWANRHQLKEGFNLSGFLFTAVRNQVFDILRHQKHIRKHEDNFQAFAAQNDVVTDHLVRERQFAALIEKEIALLPPRMREVFELRRKAYLSNKQIAEKMHISEATVADQMKKALRQLRLKLGLVYLAVILLSR